MAKLDNWDKDCSNFAASIDWQDARWFCAWLSTVSALRIEDKVFDYRLPTKAELYQIRFLVEQGKQPWTTDVGQPGNALLVVREELPKYYSELLNYLANGLWHESDQETHRVMKQILGGKFTIEGVQEFPCTELRIIDQLWTKFSGGKFGFSVQKQIYTGCGAKLDGKPPKVEVWLDFLERVGWKHERVTVSISPGKFPKTTSFAFTDAGDFAAFIFSRTESCKSE